MNEIQFEIYQRNSILESEIDLLSYRDLNVTNQLPGTLRLFMDSLFYLLSIYRETKSELDRGNVEKFLNKRVYSIPYVNDLVSRRWNSSLSNEQFDYLKELLKYIDRLRFSFTTKHENVHDVIRFIKKKCAIMLYRGSLLEDIMSFANSYIEKCNLQGFYIETKNRVGYIGFHDILNEIMIIPDWHEVKNDNSNYKKILIVNCELSEINKNFLRVNKVIEINKCKDNDILETISNVSEVYSLVNRLGLIKRQVEISLKDEFKKEILINSINSTSINLRRAEEIIHLPRSKNITDEICDLMKCAKKDLDKSFDILEYADGHGLLKQQLVLIKLGVINIIRGKKMKIIYEPI